MPQYGRMHLLCHCWGTSMLARRQDAPALLVLAGYRHAALRSAAPAVGASFGGRPSLHCSG
eukprot:2962074-Heterocapsa_arctica.AAC.1